MAQALHVLRGLVTGDTTQFDRMMTKAVKSTRELAGAWGNAGKAITSSAARITSAVTAVGSAVTKMAFDFQDQMTAVRNLVLDMSDKDFARLENGVRSLSKEFGRSTADIARGMFEMISAGADVNTVLDDMRGLMPLVVAGQADIGDAMKLVGSVVNAYNLEWSETARISDLVFKTNEKGVTNVAELAQHMGGVVNQASSLNIRLEELFGSLASITKGSKNTADAVTRLRSLLTVLAKGSDELNAIFQQQGFESSEAAVKQMGFVKATQMLVDATGGSQGKLIELLGSVEAVGGALNVTGTNAERTADFIAAMGSSSGTAGAAMTKAMANPVEQFRRVKEQVIDAARAIGIDLLPAVSQFLKSIKAGVDENGPSMARFRESFVSIVSAVLRLVAQHPRLAAFLLLLKGASMAGIFTALGQLRTAISLTITKLGLLRTAMMGVAAAGLAAVFIGIRNAVAASNAEFQKTLEQVERIARIGNQARSEKFQKAQAINDPEERRAALLQLREDQARRLEQRKRQELAARAELQDEKDAIQNGNAFMRATTAGAKMLFGADPLAGPQAAVDSAKKLTQEARAELESIDNALQAIGQAAGQAAANKVQGAGQFQVGPPDVPGGGAMPAMQQPGAGGDAEAEKAERDARVQEANTAGMEFLNTIRGLADASKLSDDAAKFLLDSMVGLSRAFKNGEISASEFSDRTLKLKMAMDQAVAAEKRKQQQELQAAKLRLLQGKGTAADRDFLRAQIEKAREAALSSQINQQFELMINNMIGANGGLQRFTDGLQSAQQRIPSLAGGGASSGGPAGGGNAPGVGQAAGMLGNFLNTGAGKVQTVLNQIQLLKQQLGFTNSGAGSFFNFGFGDKGYRFEKAIRDQLEGLFKELNALLYTPPPLFDQMLLGQAENIIGFDPGLQTGGGGPGVNVNVQNMDGQQLLNAINLELQRAGHTRFF